MDIERIIAMTHKQEANNNIPPSIQARCLLDYYKDLTTTHKFEPGQLVQIKTGLNAAYHYPAKGHPAIILEFLDPPYIDPSKNSGECNCGILHDVRIMVLASNCAGALYFVFSSR